MHATTARTPTNRAQASALACRRALAADGIRGTVPGDGRDRHHCSGPANNGIHPHGGLGGSTQLAAPTCLAVAPPAVWPHAAKLGQRRHGQPQGEMERNHPHGLVRGRVACHPYSTLGSHQRLAVHGMRAGMALAAPRAWPLNLSAFCPETPFFMYIIAVLFLNSSVGRAPDC